MSERFREEWALLPVYLAHHLVLSVTALGIGVSLSLALALAAMRWRALRSPLLLFASWVQTVPALALLALMVPLLSSIGFVPALAALVLYGMLPVLRNAITGMQGIDPALVEAATGLGMSEGQLLFRVRVPLALPVIVAGIRTATVWTVGMATLSTAVGATGLGNFIFSGLQTQNHAAVLLGCSAVTALALTLDGLIRGLEAAVRARRPRRALLWLGIFAALILVGTAPLWSEGRGGAVRIGAKTFTEQRILARLLGKLLERRGIPARSLESLGSSVVFEALAAGEIDAYVDYTGTLWANQLGREGTADSETVFDEVRLWLREEKGIECLGRLGFEDAYALAMRRERARELGIEDLCDLAVHASELAIGGDYEFFHRPEWRSVRDAYGLTFREQRSFDPALMIPALLEGRVDVVSAFTSDGRIDAFDLVLLDDPRRALLPYDAVLLLSPSAARRPDLRAAWEPLIGAIDDAAMRRANRRVDLEGVSVGRAADELLRSIERPQR